MSTCPICVETIERVYFSECLHTFCQDCIKTWAQKCVEGGQSVSCPICRYHIRDVSDIVVENIVQEPENILYIPLSPILENRDIDEEFFFEDENHVIYMLENDDDSDDEWEYENI